jgi:hypothetical protein
MCRLVNRWFICLADRRNDSLVEPRPIANHARPWESWRENQILYPERWNPPTDGPPPAADEQLPHNVVRVRHLETLLYRCTAGDDPQACLDEKAGFGEVWTRTHSCPCPTCMCAIPGAPPGGSPRHVDRESNPIPDATRERARQDNVALRYTCETAGLLRALVEKLCSQPVESAEVARYMQRSLMHSMVCIENQDHMRSGMYRCDCHTSRYGASQNLGRELRHIAALDLNETTSEELWVERLAPIVADLFHGMHRQIGEMRPAAWLTYRDVAPHEDLNALFRLTLTAIITLLNVPEGTTELPQIRAWFLENMGGGGDTAGARWWIWLEFMSFLMHDTGIAQDIFAKIMEWLLFGRTRKKNGNWFYADGSAPGCVATATFQDLVNTVERIWPEHKHTLHAATSREDSLMHTLRSNRDNVIANVETSRRRMINGFAASQVSPSEAMQQETQCLFCQEAFVEGGLHGNEFLNMGLTSEQHHRGMSITRLPCCLKPVHFSCAAGVLWHMKRCPMCRAEFAQTPWAHLVPADHVRLSNVSETFLRNSDDQDQ